MDNNTQLPAEVLEKIKAEAKHKGKNHMFIPLDGDYDSHEFHGFIVERTYETCATEYATKLHHVEQENKWLIQILLETEQGKRDELQAKGDTLAMWVRRLCNSMMAHPDYFTGINIEFIDRVDGAEEALKEWKGEKEPAKLTPEQIEERKEAIEWYRNPAAEAERGKETGLDVREKAEQWFKEEVSKIDV